MVIWWVYDIYLIDITSRSYIYHVSIIETQLGTLNERVVLLESDPFIRIKA